MESLVTQLQRECLDPNVSALEIMRKALVVSKKLGLTEFLRWINLETEGYKVGDDFPEYRIVTGQIKAWNPYRGWIDVCFDDPEMQEKLSCRPIGQPIGELESLTRTSKGTGLFHVPFDPHTENQLMRASKLPLKPTLEVSPASVTGIIEAVRTTVLNWCLNLEEKGIIGEGMTFSDKEKQKAAETSYHVHFHGSVGTSQVQQGTVQSAQSIALELNLSNVRALMDELKMSIAELGLKADTEQQLRAEIATIEAQLAAPQPRRGLIGECLASVRNILEGCIGSLLASGILQRFSGIWP